VVHRRGRRCRRDPSLLVYRNIQTIGWCVHPVLRQRWY
jgi:hypothetical protein